MTALVHVTPTKDFIPGIVGSSVSWSRVAGGPIYRSTKAYASEWSADLARRQISNGVTDGATAIQQLVQQLMTEVGEWQMRRPSRLVDVEQEVAILMPPKRERVVTLHLHHAGRARPLIHLDDVLVESDNT